MLFFSGVLSRLAAWASHARQPSVANDYTRPAKKRNGGETVFFED
jgi:hypothetical protein